MIRIQIEGLWESTNQTVERTLNRVISKGSSRTIKKTNLAVSLHEYLQNSKDWQNPLIVTKFCTDQNHKPYEITRPSTTIQKKEEKAKG